MKKLREDFDFDKECSKDNKMQPVNENGYPINPSYPSYGSNNYDWGFEYKICPLSFNLSQKGNDKKLKKLNDRIFSKKIYVGNTVTGISPKDNKKHKGKIVNFTFTDMTGTKLKYVWILDQKTMTRIYLDPYTIKVIRPDDTKPYHRFNIFATNYMHCHESLDIFSDEEQNADESVNKLYKAALIKAIDLKPEYVSDFDKLLESGDNTAKYVMCFPKGFFCQLTGLSMLRENNNYIKKMTKLFYDTYLSLMGYDASKFNYRITSENIMYSLFIHCNNSEFENCMNVTSWKALYMLYKSVITCYNYNRKSEYYIPMMSGIDHIWYNRDCHNKYYNGIVTRFLMKLCFGHELRD